MKAPENLSSKQSLERIADKLNELNDCLERLRSCPKNNGTAFACFRNSVWDEQFDAAVAELRENMRALERAAAPEQDEKAESEKN